jgi:diacylglycerol kinase family enzyme
MLAPVERPAFARRASAAACLVTFAAALVVVVLSLARHPVQLVIAVLLLGVALAAGWTALVNRGFARLLAVAAVVLAIVGTVALPDLRTYVLLPLVIGLTVLCAVCARLALGWDLAPPLLARRVGPVYHGVLLMNPKSGGGKVARFRLEEEARRRGVRPVLLQPGDDLRELAERGAANADAIGMAGGDGSQALVADVARRHDLPFVCVPAGTRNHFALDLGLDRDDVAAALDAFGDAVERRVDLALLGDRVFVNNASLGVYAMAVQWPGYREAKAATVAQQLPGLLGPGARRPDLRFRPPGGGNPQPSADVLLVSNGRYRLDRLDGFGTRSQLDSGALGVVTVSLEHARDLPALISAELTGQLARFRGYRAWEPAELVVDSGQPLVEVGVDGEALRLPPPLRFRSLPGALRVRLPLHSPGAPPAAARPDGLGRTVLALFRILAGRPARPPGTGP